MIKRILKNRAKARLVEEMLYEFAVKEYEAGIVRQGLWAKALSITGKGEDKILPCYLKLRVQAMKDEESLSYKFDETVTNDQIDRRHEPETDVQKSWGILEGRGYELETKLGKVWLVNPHHGKGKEIEIRTLEDVVIYCKSIYPDDYEN